MQSYRLAEKHEIREVATLFTESFMEYPLFPLILSQGNAYKAELFRLNYINTKSYVQQEACFVGILDGKIVSAVLLKKSGDSGPGFIQYLLNGGLALAARVGVGRIKHILNTLDKMKEACRRYGKKTWYVDSFAVAKGYQGKSLGSALFRYFIFPHVRKHGGGLITLVTHTELNRKFYCKNGFEVFSEFGIGPEGGRIPNYSFRQVIERG
ncbi:GNAT family N-acetyltransferase [Saccharibacillus sacchari]|uniref:GNAT family N-acetyltransferase n=1 Tax=Saccharibacillus sacchari TaxID=456493 RepID=A0ACC6P7N5_9BACL